MFGLSNEEKEYRKIFYERQELAISQARDFNLDLEEVIKSILDYNNLYSITPCNLSDGERLYTPRQLSGIVADILKYPSPMAPYMVLYIVKPVAQNISLEYPINFHKDLIMAFEKIRAIDERLAEKGAGFLANALCMVYNFILKPSLKEARATYKNLGNSYTAGTLDESEIKKLREECLIAGSEINGNCVLRDNTIKSLVRAELFKIDRHLPIIFGAER